MAKLKKELYIVGKINHENHLEWEFHKKFRTTVFLNNFFNSIFHFYYLRFNNSMAYLIISSAISLFSEAAALAEEAAA